MWAQFQSGLAQSAAFASPVAMLCQVELFRGCRRPHPSPETSFNDLTSPSQIASRTPEFLSPIFTRQDIERATAIIESIDCFSTRSETGTDELLRALLPAAGLESVERRSKIALRKSHRAGFLAIHFSVPPYN
jgi:hypothetical protein